MTPDLLAELVKAIRQQNWFLVAGGVLWLAGALIHLWLAKRIEAAIANKQHFSRLRYEREIEVYRELWRNVRNFYLESEGAIEWNDEPNAAPTNVSGKAAWQEARRQMVKTIEDNRPFYPAEIWSELSTFVASARSLAKCKASDSSQRSAASEMLKHQYGCIEQAIRVRLAKFDTGN